MEQTHDSPTALELYKGHPVQEAAQIILGSLLFSASMNWIILPHDMYSGGFLGIAQLLRMLLHFFPAIQQIGDLAGILYFLLNIPLLLISWFRFGHFFFAKTALCIVCYSAFLALIPIPAEGLFDETIAACVIGGVSMNGGRGSVVGSIFGALIYGLIVNMLQLLGVSGFWQQAVTGTVIIVVSCIDSMSSAKKRQ